ncbi:MAG: class F sortase, partial [Ilumatobacteraceae bacterium]
PEPTGPPSTAPLSLLSSMVGAPVPVVPAPPSPTVAPTSITIEAMGITYPVRGVGLQLDGQLEIPDETEVGWYRLGAAPGEPGSTVLAGHVSWNRVDGPFRDLPTLEPGASVRLDLADGSTREYQVVERTQYPKLALPAERIWATAGPETLVLITCGGDFNPEIRRYRDNIVVYAVPIA